MPADAASVANYFLSKGEAEGVDLDHLKLQKLAYISHGWHLGFAGGPLVIDRVEAWPYGPVFPQLYHVLKPFGMRNIHGRIMVEDPATGQERPCELGDYHLDNPEWTRQVLDWVWEKYKGTSSRGLSALTHKADTPWSEARKDKPPTARNVHIPTEMIARHYAILAEELRGKQHV